VRLSSANRQMIGPESNIRNYAGIPQFNVRDYPSGRIEYLVLKRLFDIVVSLTLLLSLSPLFALIALAIKLSTGGSVFFSQERVGRNGRRFWIYKFRTMISACKLICDTRWSHPQDERITPLGRFLRRTSLDELPQLVNVLLGDMSLVGPRPERPYYVEVFRQKVPRYVLRQSVKCGMTGWAQVNGWRGDTSIHKRLEHDLYYLQNWTFWLDVKILLLTLLRGFNHPNAY